MRFLLEFLFAMALMTILGHAVPVPGATAAYDGLKISQDQSRLDRRADPKSRANSGGSGGGGGGDGNKKGKKSGRMEPGPHLSYIKCLAEWVRLSSSLHIHSPVRP